MCLGGGAKEAAASWQRLAQSRQGLSGSGCSLTIFERRQRLRYVVRARLDALSFGFARASRNAVVDLCPPATSSAAAAATAVFAAAGMPSSFCYA